MRDHAGEDIIERQMTTTPQVIVDNTEDTEEPETYEFTSAEQALITAKRPVLIFTEASATSYGSLSVHLRDKMPFPFLMETPAASKAFRSSSFYGRHQRAHWHRGEDGKIVHYNFRDPLYAGTLYGADGKVTPSNMECSAYQSLTHADAIILVGRQHSRIQMALKQFNNTAAIMPDNCANMYTVDRAPEEAKAAWCEWRDTIRKGQGHFGRHCGI